MILESVKRLLCRRPCEEKSAYRVLWFEISQLRMIQLSAMLEGWRVKP
jgi:hypothetical protein